MDFQGARYPCACTPAVSSEPHRRRTVHLRLGGDAVSMRTFFDCRRRCFVHGATEALTVMSLSYITYFSCLVSCCPVALNLRSFESRGPSVALTRGHTAPACSTISRCGRCPPLSVTRRRRRDDATPLVGPPVAGGPPMGGAITINDYSTWPHTMELVIKLTDMTGMILYTPTLIAPSILLHPLPTFPHHHRPP